MLRRSLILTLAIVQSVGSLTAQPHPATDPVHTPPEKVNTPHPDVTTNVPAPEPCVVYGSHCTPPERLCVPCCPVPCGVYGSTACSETACQTPEAVCSNPCPPCGVVYEQPCPAPQVVYGEPCPPPHVVYRQPCTVPCPPPSCPGSCQTAPHARGQCVRPCVPEGVAYAISSGDPRFKTRNVTAPGAKGAAVAANAGRFAGLTITDMVIAAGVVGAVTLIALAIGNAFSGHL